MSGFSFTLIYAALLVKTVRISVIFNTIGKNMDRDLKTILRPVPLVSFDQKKFFTEVLTISSVIENLIKKI